MQDAVDIVDRIFVRRGPRRLEAAALINRDVDHDRTRLHQFQHVARHQLRRLGARNQHRPDHQIGVFELLADVVLGRHERLDIPGHHVRQIGKPPQRDVADRDVGARTGRRARRRRTDHARADDEDLGRLHARHAAQQDSLAAARLFEEVAPLLRGHAARDLRHGDQQRQRTVGALDGLIGTADRPAVDHRTGEGFAAGEVEEGENQLVPADEFVLGSHRFLDLDDHFRPGVDLLDRGKHLRPDGRVGIIGKSAVHTGRSLHINFVSPFDKLPGACGGKSNAILVVLDLFWNTDNHGSESF